MSSSVLKMQHVSLQFSDTKRQQVSDVEKLFARGRMFPIKTGTEAGRETFSYDALRKVSKEYDHVFHQVRGNWIAVDKKIILPGSVRKGEIFVASNKAVVGRMHDRYLATLAFTHKDPRIGRIFQGAAHYPRRGQGPNDPNNDINRLYAKEIAEWMERVAGGRALAFVNGDFNMSDRNLDWSFGEAWTSMGDELEGWKNTGHGPIDGFASFDPDRRVSAKKFEVIRDNRMFMHTDHFVCRGTWTIKHLKFSK